MPTSLSRSQSGSRGLRRLRRCRSRCRKTTVDNIRSGGWIKKLNPSHRCAAGPTGGLKPYCSCTKVHRTFSKDTRDHSRGHGRPRHPNLPYRPFRAHTIAFRYHFPDIMSHNFGSELCIYKSLAYIAEPLEVIVIFALSECVFSKCLTINKIKSSRWAFTEAAEKVPSELAGPAIIFWIVAGLFVSLCC